MKKIIVLIIALFSVIAAKSQCDKPYKPLVEFNKDTTEFIMYNFHERADCYVGKTLKEVLHDLQIPVKDFVTSVAEYANYSCAIGIHIYPIEVGTNLMDNNKEVNNIYIYWEKLIDVESEDAFRRKYGRDGWDWNEHIYDFYKDMKIKKVEAVIYEYSKYYEKYRQAELRSITKSSRIQWDLDD